MLGRKKRDDPGVAAAVKMDGTMQAQMQTGDSELVFRWGAAFEASCTTADTTASQQHQNKDRDVTQHERCMSVRAVSERGQ